jgi:hypothetical protein
MSLLIAGQSLLIASLSLLIAGLSLLIGNLNLVIGNLHLVIGSFGSAADNKAAGMTPECWAFRRFLPFLPSPGR